MSKQTGRRHGFFIQFSKRQKFIFFSFLLTVSLFFSENLLGRSGILFAFFLAFLTSALLYITNYKDIKENFSWSVFVLPFFYTLAFGLFFFLVPARILTRLMLTGLYAVGLYSLFLTQNIFTVASIRTIALLASARTVSFIITLVSYFFLSDIIFALRLPLAPTIALEAIASYFLVHQSLWTITLDTGFFTKKAWVFGLTLCLVEASVLLWFWPAVPTIVALFLTGFFYTIVGPSQVWLDKRLFRGVMWEYIWVAVIVFAIFMAFTSWDGII